MSVLAFLSCPTLFLGVLHFGGCCPLFPAMTYGQPAWNGAAVHILASLGRSHLRRDAYRKQYRVWLCAGPDLATQLLPSALPGDGEADLVLPGMDVMSHVNHCLWDVGMLATSGLLWKACTGSPDKRSDSPSLDGSWTWRMSFCWGWSL